MLMTSKSTKPKVKRKRKKKSKIYFGTLFKMKLYDTMKMIIL